MNGKEKDELIREYQRRLAVIDDIIDEMKKRAGIIPANKETEEDDSLIRIWEEDLKDEPADTPECDFEGKGILRINPISGAYLITCEDADAWLDETGGCIRGFHMRDMPYLVVFDEECAIKRGKKWLVMDDVLIFAHDGKTFKPLDIGEICELCLYFADHSGSFRIDGEDIKAFVLKGRRN